MAGEFEDIRSRLEQISEELADLAIERLRESIDAGGVELPVDERRLTRARGRSNGRRRSWPNPTTATGSPGALVQTGSR